MFLTGQTWLMLEAPMGWKEQSDLCLLSLWNSMLSWAWKEEDLQWRTPEASREIIPWHLLMENKMQDGLPDCNGT